MLIRSVFSFNQYKFKLATLLFSAVTIFGLGFLFFNIQAKADITNRQISIEKTWQDGKDNSTRPFPEITISTDDPTKPQSEATLSQNWKTIMFADYTEAQKLKHWIKYPGDDYFSLTVDTLPAGAKKIDEGNTDYNIYAWMADSDSDGINDTLNYWSDANRIYLPTDSSMLFFEMTSDFENNWISLNGWFENLETINLATFDTSRVTNMSRMFYSAYSLTEIDISDKWQVDQVTNSEDMFLGASNLPNYNASATDKSKADYSWNGGYLTYTFSYINNITFTLPSDASQYSCNESNTNCTITVRDDLGFTHSVRLTKNEDTWAYDIQVSRDDSTYYAWEAEMAGYTVSNTIDSPAIMEREKINLTNTIKLEGEIIIDKTWGGRSDNRESRPFPGITISTDDPTKSQSEATNNTTLTLPNDASQYNCDSDTTCTITVTDNTGIKHAVQLVKNGDTWTYTVKVVDDAITYYGWEAEMEGYTVSNTIKNPAVSKDKKIELTNWSTDLLVNKTWQDNKDNSTRPFPEITVSTKDPTKPLTEVTLSRDWKDIIGDEKYDIYDFIKYPGNDYASLTVDTLPAGAKKIDDGATDYSIYAWISDGYNEELDWHYRTLNYWSDADKAYLPTDSSYLFFECFNLEVIDLSIFDTSRVTNMSHMFETHGFLWILDLSNFDTSNVTDMSWMFSDAWAVEELDLSTFDTSNVTNMAGMFSNTVSLISLDLSTFDTSNVTDMSRMFYGSSLTSLDLSTFDTSNVTDMSRMFDGSSLTSLDLSTFDTSNVTNMSWMFAGVTLDLDLSNFDTSRVTDMSWMFAYASSLTSLDLSTFDTSNVTNMAGMFAYASSLTSLDLSIFNTSNVTNMSGMFENASSLTSLDLSTFDTSNVTDMSRMFLGAISLTSLDLSTFDTSRVTDMSRMFAASSYLSSPNPSSLTSLDLSTFDTSNVTDMSWMFHDASSLTSLDLSTFDTSNVTDMYGMFFGASSLEEIEASDKWQVDQVTDSNYMFYGARRLPNYNGGAVDKIKAYYGEGGYLTYKDYNPATPQPMQPTSPTPPTPPTPPVQPTQPTPPTPPAPANGRITFTLPSDASQYSCDEANTTCTITVQDNAGIDHEVQLVKQGSSWIYTIKVANDNITYYAWEAEMENYEVSNTIDNPAVSEDKKIELTNTSTEPSPSPTPEPTLTPTPDNPADDTPTLPNTGIEAWMMSAVITGMLSLVSLLSAAWMLKKRS